MKSTQHFTYVRDKRFAVKEEGSGTRHIDRRNCAWKSFKKALLSQQNSLLHLAVNILAIPKTNYLFEKEMNTNYFYFSLILF